MRIMTFSSVSCLAEQKEQIDVLVAELDRVHASQQPPAEIGDTTGATAALEKEGRSSYNHRQPPTSPLLELTLAISCLCGSSGYPARGPGPQ